ncbi:MAG: quinone oxidoreductase family protein [Acidimicrobiales bacterium]
MRAILVTEPGGPDVLTVADVPTPEPEPGEVIIHVEAAGVNFIDTYQRSGLYPMDFPFIPGPECGGTVSAVGPDVADFSVGDRVTVSEGAGGYAEFRSAPAKRLMPVPDGVGIDVATAASLQGMTAHYLASDTFQLGPGHRCLIHAGAGGTGRLLVQLAKRAGAEVFTTVGSPEKAELAISAGADHVIRYTEVDFADEVRRMAGTEKPLDVVFDGVGAAVFDDSLNLLRRRGVMVTFGNASGPVEPVPPLRLMSGGSLYLTRPSLFDYIADTPALRARGGDVFQLVASGDLDVRIDSVYPLDQAADAHRHLEARGTTGKLLLAP